MEKKLAVIVDNNEEITTEITDTEMCSSENTDTCGDGGIVG